MEYRLSGKISEKAFYEMQRFNVRKTKLVFLLVFNIVMLAVFLRDNADDSLFFWIFTAFFLIAFNFLLSFLMRYTLKIKSRKAYRSGKKLNGLPRQIHITAQEIQQNTSFSTMTITPDMVYKVAHNNDREIYIYLATNQILILSKDWLENGEWADFITFIKKNWEPKK
ncbi:hypothetical protein GHK52_00035 [Lactococcus garvieae]|nr:hypothetical protein [Lactococcus garvieae]